MISEFSRSHPYVFQSLNRSDFARYEPGYAQLIGKMVQNGSSGRILIMNDAHSLPGSSCGSGFWASGQILGESILGPPGKRLPASCPSHARFGRETRSRRPNHPHRLPVATPTPEFQQLHQGPVLAKMDDVIEVFGPFMQHQHEGVEEEERTVSIASIATWDGR